MWRIGVAPRGVFEGGVFDFREDAAEGVLEFVKGFADGEGNVASLIFPSREIEGLAWDELFEAGLGDMVAVAKGAEVVGRPEGGCRRVRGRRGGGVLGVGWRESGLGRS